MVDKQKDKEKSVKRNKLYYKKNKNKPPKCDEDCFNCKYSDCIL